MHAQTIQTTTQATEVTTARALAAMLLATDRTKEERRKLDDLFPQAQQAESRLAWKGIAKGVKNLHRQISFGDGKPGDDQGVVGDAYRKASRASHRDSGASAQLAAHVAIETIAKSFVSDGTYANYAVNPDGIAHISALVGDLQAKARGSALSAGLDLSAVGQVFFAGWRKADAAGAVPSGSPRAPSPDRAAWDAAVAEYEAAHRAYHEAAVKDLQPLLDEVENVESAFRAPSLHQGLSIRWLTAEALQKDLLLTAEAKALLAPGATQACAIRQAGLNARSDDAEDARIEGLAEAMWQAEKRLTDMTPPDVAGAAYKVAVQARESDDDKFGFNDLGLVSYLLHTYRGSGDIVRTYLDLLRIAGIDHPSLSMEQFDPEAWIAAYEALGGKVSNPRGNLVITYAADDGPDSAALRAELAATPWKYRAVYLEAERRKGEGGDPFVDSSGGAGKDDRRGGSTKFYGHIERADHILFSTDAETGLPVPHLEHIDNRFSPWLPTAFGVRAGVERSLIAAE